MRILAMMAALLLLDACAGGWTDMQILPVRGHRSNPPDAVYHTGIDGQGIEVRTWTDGKGYRSEATSQTADRPNPNPALAEAAQRVASLNCPSGYRIIDESSSTDFFYTISYNCTS